VKVFLVGNKSDLSSKREVEFEEGVKFKEENNLYYFTETSAMNGSNANKVT
jgi:Ras-related protein Rab-5C